MPTEKIDRRIQKTRQHLEDALIDLMIEKGYEATTVQDIISKAHVGRTTFYAHYHNKTELLDDCFESLDKVLEQHERVMVDEGAGDGDFILGLFQFVEQNQRLFKALFERQDGITNRHAYNHLYRSIYDNLLTQLQNHLKVLSPDNDWCEPAQFEILAHYFVSAFLGIAIWWLGKDLLYTTEEISGYFQQLALAGFSGTLGVIPSVV